MGGDVSFYLNDLPAFLSFFFINVLLPMLNFEKTQYYEGQIKYTNYEINWTFEYI